MNFSSARVLIFLAGWCMVNVVFLFALEAPPFGPHPEVPYQVPHNVRAAFTEGKIVSAESSLAYRISSPKGAGPWPLLVFLHGAGQRGSDNLSQLRYLPEVFVSSEWRRRFPCIVLAPQCPENSSWLQELGAVERLVDEWRCDPRIDGRRVYLTGLSMGGFGVWDLATRRPEWFAAVVPICGGGDPDSGARLVNVPIWAVHGDADESVSVDLSRRTIAAIRAAGGVPRYSELPGVGHDSWTPTYQVTNETIDWMFRQRNRRCECCQ